MIIHFCSHFLSFHELMSCSDIWILSRRVPCTPVPRGHFCLRNASGLP